MFLPCEDICPSWMASPQGLTMPPAWQFCYNGMGCPMIWRERSGILMSVMIISVASWAICLAGLWLCWISCAIHAVWQAICEQRRQHFSLSLKGKYVSTRQELKGRTLIFSLQCLLVVQALCVSASVCVLLRGYPCCVDRNTLYLKCQLQLCCCLLIHFVWILSLSVCVFGTSNIS